MAGKRQPTVTREQIIAGAALVFDRVGYGNAALSAITDEAGVTKGALYFHFSSKEELALAVIETQHALAMTVARDAAERNGSPLAALQEITREFARLLLTSVIMRAGIKLTLESSIISVRVVEPYEEWQTTCQTFAEKAVAAGELRSDLDTEAFARFIVSSFTGAQLVSGVLSERADLLQRVDQLWDFLLRQQT
ncbi:ScbR family autoregulator-binding transcription factor [Saxibacter everestensis]|uniref:ScbR family autoregulator-binding transcription factor n=1 Tax=Saxibacter everestensis TaxID=2909229 RepID=A0ABY8QVG8_9MICO|nr:ScbR family autoregulator-binding transcription factor [Brevibacteriaceae bacterium ZFBP1038]